MRDLPRLRLLLKFGAAIAVCYLGWTFASRYVATDQWTRRQRTRETAPNSEFDRIYGGSSVRILNFYARDGNMTEGDATVLCYGVLNAKSVRIDPPVEGISPALSRCVAVKPEQETRYRLIAEGADGQVAEASFVLPVNPDYASFPQITSFLVTGQRKNGQRKVYSVYFAARNADEISIDPPAFPAIHGAPYGHFYVEPVQTTTYTLTATGKKGRKAQRQLTIRPGDRD